MLETGILGLDTEKGLLETFHFDDTTGEVTIAREQVLDDIIEDAKARFNTFDERAPWKGDMHHVGVVPDVIWYDLRRRYPNWEEFEQKLIEFLNDPNYSMFRTRPGRIGKR